MKSVNMKIVVFTDMEPDDVVALWHLARVYPTADVSVLITDTTYAQACTLAERLPGTWKSGWYPSNRQQATAAAKYDKLADSPTAPQIQTVRPVAGTQLFEEAEVLLFMSPLTT